MRVKKQKQVRRHVRFYKVCFGFREPYKVLCDGNFVHQSLQGRKEPVEQSLPKFLGAAVKPMVTKCVMAELRGLGSDFKATVGVARHLMMAQCGHEEPLPAADCILSLVGKENAEHYFVATQDVQLRKALRAVPGTALLFAAKLGLALEPPSEEQQRYAKLSEAERQHLNEREAQLVEAREAQRKAAAEAAAREAEGNEEEGPDEEEEKPVQLPHKRKQAKGPNPLSMKKKAKLTGISPTSKDTKAEGNTEGKKRNRARKRSRRKKSEHAPSDAPTKVP